MMEYTYAQQTSQADPPLPHGFYWADNCNLSNICETAGSSSTALPQGQIMTTLDSNSMTLTGQAELMASTLQTLNCSSSIQGPVLTQSQSAAPNTTINMPSFAQPRPSVMATTESHSSGVKQSCIGKLAPARSTSGSLHGKRSIRSAEAALPTTALIGSVRPSAHSLPNLAAEIVSRSSASLIPSVRRTSAHKDDVNLLPVQLQSHSAAWYSSQHNATTAPVLAACSSPSGTALYPPTHRQAGQSPILRTKRPSSLQSPGPSAHMPSPVKSISNEDSSWTVATLPSPVRIAMHPVTYSQLPVSQSSPSWQIHTSNLASAVAHSNCSSSSGGSSSSKRQQGRQQLPSPLTHLQQQPLQPPSDAASETQELESQSDELAYIAEEGSGLLADVRLSDGSPAYDDDEIQTIMCNLSDNMLASSGQLFGTGGFGSVRALPWLAAPDGLAALKTCVLAHGSVRGFLNECAMAGLLFKESEGVGFLELFGVCVSSGPSMDTMTGHMVMEQGEANLREMVDRQVDEADEMEDLWRDRTLYSEEEIPALLADLQLGHSLELVGWLLDILDALGLLETVGVVHGDLKPPNVMIRNNRAALIDFGASLFLRKKSSAKQGGGTNGYLAPEGFHTDSSGTDGGKVSHSSDAFSFILMFGELVGRHVRKIFSAVAPGLFWELQLGLMGSPEERPTIRKLTDLLQEARGEMIRYAPGGSNSIDDLVTLQSSVAAVRCCSELSDFNTFVLLGRLQLNQSVKEESFPEGWDMRAAWKLYDSVGLNSHELYDFMFGVRFPIWLQLGGRGDVLPGIRKGLDELDQE